ncbi:unnamed protein product [Acanthoscelides obtectus]|uniref:Uncharacterized protein n=1 Tax=Acanthoscelides obtectus TaxID=200917 RepID=A0A9P0L5Y6_ACAOB|nr:unnamed protein product [Acanthoscelides obtectus]CAK1676403.1 hypothetical protein AOBTE_LOCUS30735 [Acanthoscelides obtectus]
MQRHISIVILECSISCQRCPGGQAVPTQVQPVADGQFRAEFIPRVVGEHRVAVSVKSQPVAGSPFAAKAYDVNAIRWKQAKLVRGTWK